MESVGEKIKVMWVAVLSGLSAWLGILAVPVLVLLALEVVDYGTGLAAAPYRNEQVNSYKGINGIIKKVCLLLLVAVAGGLDFVIAFAAESIGLTMPFNFVIASVVAVWLICNEVISILENMIDIGVKLPPFLQSIAKYIRKQAESKADMFEEGKEEE